MAALIDILLAIPKIISLIQAALSFLLQLKAAKEQAKVEKSLAAIKNPEIEKADQVEKTHDLSKSSF